MQRHYPLNPSTGLEDAAQLPWSNGNPSTGQNGSYPPFGLFTDPQDEILSAIAGCGLTPDSTITQLLAAVSRGIFVGPFSGTANAIAATIPGAVVLPSLYTGLQITGTVGTTNSGPVTLNLTGFTTPAGAKNVIADDGSALVAGDLLGGTPVRLIYDGTAWRLRGVTVSMLKSRPAGRNLFAQSTPGTYTYTVPASVFWLYVTCVGAGGGAPGTNPSASTSGGGGGAGGTAAGWIQVTPGQVITYIVGAGGTGVGYGGIANPGGISSIGSYMNAPGGSGGQATLGPGSSAGGAGGFGAGGQQNLYGGNGSDGSLVSATIQGGSGGASSLGGGGRSVSGSGSAPLLNGRALGSGAGAAYSNNSDTFNGGNGAAGYVSFSY